MVGSSINSNPSKRNGDINMKKSLLVLVSLLILLSGSQMVLAKSNDNVNDSKQIIPAAYVNELLTKDSRTKLTDAQIPTIDDVNNALKELTVSKNNPYQEIDLGNGFTVEATVSGETTTLIDSQNDLSAKAATIYNATATGSFSVKVLGVTLYNISVSNNYSYNSDYKIVSYQDPPSAGASGFVGWSASITNKEVISIDDTAKDAIADATYTYFKIGGSYSGHIELRFTATGNWYIHDTYIGDAEY